MRALRVQGLTRVIRHDGGELVIVRDVDLLVMPGQVIGITGPSDAGHRSLLRLIVGLDKRSTGEVELLHRPDESPVDVTEIAAFRQEVVLVSALDPLLDDGIETLRRTLANLTATRLRDCESPPTGEQIAVEAGSVWGKRTDRASPSERLRLLIGLARTLRPSHLLIDVPAPVWSAEDRRTFVAVVRRATAEGIGVVLATQDEVMLAALASEVRVFLDGVCTGGGTPAELMPAALEAWKTEDDAR